MTHVFSGCNALLLGGSCELALVVAEMMIHAELFPILTYRDQKGLEEIDRCLGQYRDTYKAIECDLSRRDTIHVLFDYINENLDFLVDFAHGHLESLVASTDSDDVYTYFSENISARAEVIKLASRVMLKKRKGRLVFISSSAARKPNPGQGFYAAAKLASEALYRNVGLELGSRGISTITLRPGYIDSGRGRRYFAEKKEMYPDKVKEFGVLSCKEVAEAILHILSNSASGYTEIEMDGDR